MSSVDIRTTNCCMLNSPRCKCSFYAPCGKPNETRRSNYNVNCRRLVISAVIFRYPKFDRFQVKIDPRTFRKALVHREQYGKVINQCVNYDLKTQYELTAFSQLEYCLSSEDKVKLDYLDMMFCAVFGALMAMTVICSWLDKVLKKTRATAEEKENHYKLSLTGARKLKNWTGIRSE